MSSGERPRCVDSVESCGICSRNVNRGEAAFAHYEAVRIAVRVIEFSGNGRGAVPVSGRPGRTRHLDRSDGVLLRICHA
jgi:hypothetical protein